jgi:hypothetical protein
MDRGFLMEGMVSEHLAKAGWSACSTSGARVHRLLSLRSEPMAAFALMVDALRSMNPAP